MKIFQNFFLFILLLMILQQSYSATISESTPLIDQEEKQSDGKNKLHPKRASQFSLQLTGKEKQWLKEHSQINIAFDGDYAPYSFQNSQGQFNGIAVDFARELAHRIGIKLNIYSDGTWKGLYNAAQQHKVDVIATLVKRPERQQWFEFTKPYLSLAQYILTTKDNQEIITREQIADKTVALVETYSTTRYLLEEFPTVQPYYVNNLSEALAAVITGKADATLAAMGIAQHLIAQQGIVDLKFAVLFAQGLSEQRFGVRKDWPELASILDKALASLSEDERLQIFQRWSRPEIAKIEVVRISSFISQLTKSERVWLSEHPEIQVGTMNAWPPMDFVDQQGKPQGIGAQFVDALNLRLNGALKMFPESWETIYNGVKKGDIDVLMGITPRAEREKYFHFTSPYIEVPHVIFSRSDLPVYAGLADLKGKKVAVEQGFFIVKLLRDKFPEIEVKEYHSTSDALDAVSKGAVDAYIGNRAVAMYIIANELIANLHQGGKIKEASSINAIGVRKDWLILKNILQKGLDNISQKEKREIVSKWVAPDKEMPTMTLTVEEKRWLAAHPVIRAAIDRNWAPIEFLDDEDNFQGISSDYINRLEKLLGIKFEIAKDLSWQASMDAFKRGELDIFTSLKQTPERDALFGFSDIYNSFPITIFTGPEVPYITSMKELNGRKVGVVKDYAIHELLASNHPDIELDTSSDITEALEKLSRGEIDVYVGNILTTSYYIAQLGYTHLKVAGETPYRYEQSIGVRKDWPELVSILNKAFAAIPEDERININKRWIGVRYEHEFDYSLLWKILPVILIIFALFTYWNRRLSQLNQQLTISRDQEKVAMQEAQQARIEVEQTNKQLKDLDKLKSMFIASMSHELRTPLNSIIGFSGLMLQGISGDLNSQQKDSMERIHRSGNHLLGLISDVIDISKIEAGRIDTFSGHFALKELVEEAIDSVSLQAINKGITLEVQTEVWPEMNSDRKRLLQCLLNYLSNAVKFTETGKVTLTISVNKEMLAIRVSDTGIGIAENDISKLFEAFERLETHLQVKAGGTGLGLYLTKKITEELLQGSVSVESHIDKGSTFGLNIPIDLEK